MIAHGHLIDELMGTHSLGGGNDLFLGGVQPPITDVAENIAAKDEAVLEHDTQLAAQGFQRYLGNVLLGAVGAFQGNFAATQVIEAAEQIHHRGFPRACGSHQGDALAGADVQVQVLEHGLPFLIAEIHMVEMHFAGEGGELRGIGGVGHLHRFIHGFENTLQVGNVIHKRVVDIRQVGNGLPEAADVGAHGQDDAKGDDFAAHPVDTRNVQEGENNLREGLRGEPYSVGHIDGAHPGHAASLGQALHDGAVFLLPGKDLAQAYTVDTLGQVGVVVGVFVALHLPGLALPGLENPHDGNENGQSRNDDRGQRHIQAEHEHHDDRDVDDFQNAVDNTVGENVRHGVHIVDYPHQDLAGRPAVIVAEGQLLQVMEQVLADVVDNFLAHIGHDPGTNQGEHNADGDENGKDDRPVQQGFHVLVGDGHIQYPLHDFGGVQAGNGSKDAQPQGQQHLGAVAADILKSALEMFPLKRGLQYLVLVKLVAGHQAAPPSTGRSFCRA